MIVSALRGGGVEAVLPDRRHPGATAAATATGASGEWLVVEADESDRSLLRCMSRSPC
jgi:UDP-N-acetylmuramate-alanine ligase